jgi:hypothetical protein
MGASKVAQASCLSGARLHPMKTGWKPVLVRLRVRTNSGVEVPIGQNTGCP